MYDVVIVGGGPAGYAAALYAHNYGLETALVEKDELGGTCLLRGCIPAKAWLQAAEVFTTVANAGEFGVQTSEPGFDWGVALARKQQIVDGLVSGLKGLLKQRKVDVVNGFGRLDGPGRVVVDDGARVLETRNVIVATGSVPRSIPGYEFDGERIVSSDHALDWAERPQRVAIIGAGAIGCEFASLLVDLGSEVTLFELMDQIVPGADAKAARELQKHLKRRGVKIHTGVSVGEPRMTDGGVVVPFGEDSVEVDVVLVAVGRAPVTDSVGLQTTRAQVDRGYVVADLETMQTAEPGVYAVGDLLAGTPQLAHAGFAEGIAAVTHIATGRAAGPDYRAIPLVVYTHPEMAEVGLTEAAAVEQGFEVETHSHSFLGVGRARIIGQNQGMVKVVVQKDGPILGASVVGPQAGELIHELMYIVGWEALPEEAAAFIHAHPTLSEAVGETLLSSTGRSLH
ncbi:MAG: dihydrolipoyl dehydrogenase [Actinobacteria bacterium]|nr:dihydrolipoyl dehydrogenase [Actinomycetota bacterium]NIT94910.1 dihydrolipoyl dehydrogenase [Actinomycetota bacterium]NIU18577.1 dihydrolipoyl dehydrogenase [Actinomycetota bacterium]NIV55053.1 dihydrolipoyl dehydrogenase [Actinomycetota bacterium]NIX49895.1 dihydrolipoyl dehydrogenase [Actinomycetota bacterium]